MTARARLGAAGAIAIGCSAVAAIAARATWFTVSDPGRIVPVRGLGAPRFGDATVAVSGQEVAGDVVAITVLMLIATGLALLAGRWGRVLLYGLAALAGAAAIVLAQGVSERDALAVARQERPSLSAGASVHRRWAPRMTQGAAALAVASSILVAPAALRARRVSLPETGPLDEPA